MKKVMLAFSGGLDTSFAVVYLIDQGYQVITATVDTGGFSDAELKAIAQKSKQLGAEKHYLIDGKQLMFDTVIADIIKTNGLYQGSYPNMCADRYIIAQEVLKIAAKESTNMVAHGSSAMGNDQVRFDLSLMTLNPQVEIISPTKEIGGSRQQEEAYLQEKGFTVPTLHHKYSVNQNILGLTYSGSEIDQVAEPDESMFIWTKPTKSKPTYLTIEFKHGLPIALNGKTLTGVAILQKLNQIAGSYGYGRGYYTGDCIIGIKGHIVFEAPGILTLLTAHRALEQLVLMKNQQELASQLGHLFTDLLYTGKFFEPVMNDIKVLIDAQQKLVNGQVKLQLLPNQVYPVAVTAPQALLSPAIATYAQSCSWSVAEANGFIKLFGLQGKISAEIHKQPKGKE